MHVPTTSEARYDGQQMVAPLEMRWSVKRIGDWRPLVLGLWCLAILCVVLCRINNTEPSGAVRSLLVEPSRGGGTGGEWLTEMRYLFTVCHSLGPMGLDDGARWLTWAYVVLRWLTNGLRHWCFIRTKRKQCVVGGPRREAKTSVGTGVAWLIRVEKMFCMAL